MLGRKRARTDDTGTLPAAFTDAAAIAAVTQQRLQLVDERLASLSAAAAGPAPSLFRSSPLGQSQHASLSTSLHTRRLRRRVFAALLVEREPAPPPTQAKVLRGGVTQLLNLGSTALHSDTARGGAVSLEFFAGSFAVLEVLAGGGESPATPGHGRPRSASQPRSAAASSRAAADNSAPCRVVDVVAGALAVLHAFAHPGPGSRGSSSAGGVNSGGGAEMDLTPAEEAGPLEPPAALLLEAAFLLQLLAGLVSAAVLLAVNLAADEGPTPGLSPAADTPPTAPPAALPGRRPPHAASAVRMFKVAAERACTAAAGSGAAAPLSAETLLAAHADAASALTRALLSEVPVLSGPARGPHSGPLSAPLVPGMSSLQTNGPAAADGRLRELLTPAPPFPSASAIYGVVYGSASEISAPHGGGNTNAGSPGPLDNGAASALLDLLPPNLRVASYARSISDGGALFSHAAGSRALLSPRGPAHRSGGGLPPPPAPAAAGGASVHYGGTLDSIWGSRGAPPEWPQPTPATAAEPAPKQELPLGSSSSSSSFSPEEAAATAIVPGVLRATLREAEWPQQHGVVMAAPASSAPRDDAEPGVPVPHPAATVPRIVLRLRHDGRVLTVAVPSAELLPGHQCWTHGQRHGGDATTSHQGDAPAPPFACEACLAAQRPQGPAPTAPSAAAASAPDGASGGSSILRGRVGGPPAVPAPPEEDAPLTEFIPMGELDLGQAGGRLLGLAPQVPPAAEDLPRPKRQSAVRAAAVASAVLLADASPESRSGSEEEEEGGQEISASALRKRKRKSADGGVPGSREEGVGAGGSHAQPDDPAGPAPALQPPAVDPIARILGLTSRGLLGAPSAAPWVPSPAPLLPVGLSPVLPPPPSAGGTEVAGPRVAPHSLGEGGPEPQHTQRLVATPHPPPQQQQEAKGKATWKKGKLQHSKSVAAGIPAGGLDFSGGTLPAAGATATTTSAPKALAPSAAVPRGRCGGDGGPLDDVSARYVLPRGSVASPLGNGTALAGAYLSRSALWTHPGCPLDGDPGLGVVSEPISWGKHVAPLFLPLAQWEAIHGPAAAAAAGGGGGAYGAGPASRRRSAPTAQYSPVIGGGNSPHHGSGAAGQQQRPAAAGGSPPSPLASTVVAGGDFEYRTGGAADGAPGLGAGSLSTQSGGALTLAPGSPPYDQPQGGGALGAGRSGAAAGFDAAPRGRTPAEPTALGSPSGFRGSGGGAGAPQYPTGEEEEPNGSAAASPLVLGTSAAGFVAQPSPPLDPVHPSEGDPEPAGAAGTRNRAMSSLHLDHDRQGVRAAAAVVAGGTVVGPDDLLAASEPLDPRGTHQRLLYAAAAQSLGSPADLAPEGSRRSSSGFPGANGGGSNLFFPLDFSSNVASLCSSGGSAPSAPTVGVSVFSLTAYSPTRGAQNPPPVHLNGALGAQQLYSHLALGVPPFPASRASFCDMTAEVSRASGALAAELQGGPGPLGDTRPRLTHAPAPPAPRPLNPAMTTWTPEFRELPPGTVQGRDPGRIAQIGRDGGPVPGYWRRVPSAAGVVLGTHSLVPVHASGAAEARAPPAGEPMHWVRPLSAWDRFHEEQAAKKLLLQQQALQGVRVTAISAPTSAGSAAPANPPTAEGTAEAAAEPTAAPSGSSSSSSSAMDVDGNPHTGVAASSDESAPTAAATSAPAVDSLSACGTGTVAGEEVVPSPADGSPASSSAAVAAPDLAARPPTDPDASAPVQAPRVPGPSPPSDGADDASPITPLPPSSSAPPPPFPPATSGEAEDDTDADSIGPEGRAAMHVRTDALIKRRMNEAGRRADKAAAMSGPGGGLGSSRFAARAPPKARAPLPTRLLPMAARRGAPTAAGGSPLLQPLLPSPPGGALASPNLTGAPLDSPAAFGAGGGGGGSSQRRTGRKASTAVPRGSQVPPMSSPEQPSRPAADLEAPPPTGGKCDGGNVGGTSAGEAVGLALQSNGGVYGEAAPAGMVADAGMLTEEPLSSELSAADPSSSDQGGTGGGTAAGQEQPEGEGGA